MQLVTKKYLRYEKNLLREYKKQVRRLEMTRSEQQELDRNEVLEHISKELHN